MMTEPIASHNQKVRSTKVMILSLYSFMISTCICFCKVSVRVWVGGYAGMNGLLNHSKNKMLKLLIIQGFALVDPCHDFFRKSTFKRIEITFNGCFFICF